MRTKITIGLIALGAFAAVLVTGILILVFWGLLFLAAFAVVGFVVVGAYLSLIRPWHVRWGATDEEVARRMPGDEIIPMGRSTTRAITVDAEPEEIWPWIKQVGYGRAGWYSYDWIDNDGKRSAEQIRWDLQRFDVGQQIAMVPGMGPVVREIFPEHYFVAGDETSGTWCLQLQPVPGGRTRLISRWRQNWKLTPATAFWLALAGPGAFIMEQKMLRGIKARAEGMRASRSEVTAIAPVEASNRRCVMKIVVVYESMFGNTQVIAEAIAKGLMDVADVKLGSVDELSPEDARSADLIVAGGPTHAHGMARKSTRFPKADNPKYQPPLPGHEVLRDWIDKMPEGTAECAAFDTRFDKPAWLTGSAAKKIARKLATKGYEVVGIESFFVDGGDGPLAAGEAERATVWARELGGAATSRLAS